MKKIKGIGGAKVWWIIDNRVWIGSTVRPPNAQTDGFETEKQAIAWLKKKDIKPLTFKQWKEKKDEEDI